MTEPLLRDGLSEFGRGLFEAADAEAPSPAARNALLMAIAGTAAVTTAVTTASAPAAAAVKGGLAAHAGASAGIATKGAAALGAKLLVASAISVATTAVVVGELRNADAPTAPAVVATVASGATSRPRMPALPASSSREITEPVSPDEEALAVVEPAPPPVNVDAPTTIVRGAPATRASSSRAEPSPEPSHDETSASTEESERGRSSFEPESAPPAASPAPHGAAPDETASAASLGAQIAAIDGARAELRSGNARRALASIEAFEHRFGETAPLSPEAMLVRVQAHLALGERRLAENAASALIREHPSSVSARRAASLVGAGD